MCMWYVVVEYGVIWCISVYMCYVVVYVLCCREVGCCGVYVVCCGVMWCDCGVFVYML